MQVACDTASVNIKVSRFVHVEMRRQDYLSNNNDGGLFLPFDAFQASGVAYLPVLRTSAQTQKTGRSIVDSFIVSSL